MSLEFNFNNFCDIIELCVETIEDKEEDELVQFNALCVIKKSNNTEILEKFKERLLNVKAPEKIKNSISEMFNK